MIALLPEWNAIACLASAAAGGIVLPVFNPAFFE
jgi:hypothetical protein